MFFVEGFHGGWRDLQVSAVPSPVNTVPHFRGPAKADSVFKTESALLDSLPIISADARLT